LAVFAVALRHIAKYPTPRAMMADNDLALSRVLEVVLKSPRWKSLSIPRSIPKRIWLESH
jgi:hypothetical protein